MSATPTVPVTITPEAAALVAEVGMQKELEQMLEHTRQVVPGLTRIEVVYREVYDTGGDPGIQIYAFTNETWGQGDQTWSNWSRWKVTTFPPQVCVNFTFSLAPGEGHAG